MLSDDIKVSVNEYLTTSKMWELCKFLLEKENNRYKDLNLDNLRKAIYYAVEKIETIRNVLPKFTVHGMQHSCNVLDIMGKLLESMQIIKSDENGVTSNLISSYEVALLILSAFFHDIGMCLLEKDWDVSEEEWYDDYSSDKLYLNIDELKRKYIRECHHLRVKLFIDDYSEKNPAFVWIENNSNQKPFFGLESICRSHNEGKAALEKLGNIMQQDEKFCAILLRLADILDLDNTRAPLNEMENIKFEETLNDIHSWYEWKKHRDAGNISFDSDGILRLLGKTEDVVVYQKLSTMVIWIKEEFELCREVLRSTSSPYSDKRLPQMICNDVMAKGFEVGRYTYEIEKNDAINLFMGEKLYMDKMVFVRELLQNSIDASICYQKIKERELRNLGYMGGINVKPVTIHVWKADMDNVSFLIEDNGIGMNREVILDYFLKIGKSFYNSDKFIHSGISFIPISRFGVGFLSAFLATDEIIVVTKHYKESDILLQLTLNKKVDQYVLRENNRNANKYDIRQQITDWNGNHISFAKIFKEKECGTLIYFKIKEGFIDDDLEQFTRAINKYLLFAPVQVYSDINGTVINPKNLQRSFMKSISVQLDKNEVCRALHKNVKAFSEDEEIFFESLPISINYSDDNGSINGKLQVLTVYDTKQNHGIYNFSYSLNYEEDSIDIRLGGYQKTVSSAELDINYQTLGLINKVKIYFNGINHLSVNSEVQSDRMAPCFFGGFLMLEGKFRPEVDVARSGKGYLGLETMACLNYLYWKELQDYVGDDPFKRNAYFSLRQPDVLLNTDNVFYIEHEIRDKGIQSYDWNAISIIKTEKGFLSVNEIKEHFRNSNSEEIELLENISLNDSLDFRALLIRYLLKNNFKMVLKISENIDRVFIKNAKRDVLNDVCLPPLFLIEYENLEVLKYGNYPLNCNHWFSKWLIEMCKSESFEKSRGCLIRYFRKDLENNPYKRDELVCNVNKILHKYMKEVLENRDINTYKPDERDLRDWLQIFE